MSKLCIVCGKPIAKRMVDYTFRLPRAAVEDRSGPFGHRRIEARAAGDRDVSTHGGMVTLYLDELPQTREDVRRLTNGQVMSHRRALAAPGKTGPIEAAGVWDGESYRSEFFHADRCAVRQGYAAAQHGHRYKWTDQ